MVKKTNETYSKINTDGTMEASGEAYSLADLIKECKIDEKLWYCYDFTIERGAWDVTMAYRDQDLEWTPGTDAKGNDTQIMSGHSIRKPDGVTKTNRKFLIKAKFKRISEIVDLEKFRKDMIEAFTAVVPQAKVRSYKLSGKNMLEIDLFDVHFGKLGWIKETGSGSYDAKIAEEVFLRAIQTLLERATKVCGIEKILFPVGNDFFNADNSYPLPATTRGTPQQEDLRWQKTFQNGRMLVEKAIELMLEVAPVDIIIVPGNHDFQRSFYLGDSLECLYRSHPHVSVNNDAIPHKFYEYGNTLLGFTHGNSKDVSIDRLKMLMQNMQKKAWARTLFHEWHLGDIHHKKIIKAQHDLVQVASKFKKGQITEEDIQGLVIRYMRSISGDDGWHTGKGFLGSIKGAEAYIYNRKEGPIHIVNFNAPQRMYKQ